METQAPASSSSNRVYSGLPAAFIKGATALFAVYVLLYVSGVLSYFDVYLHPARYNAIALLYALVLCYLTIPARKGAARSPIPWYDIVAILLSILVNMYVFINYAQILKFKPINPFEMVLGVIEIVLILEAVRRAIDPIVSVLGVVFLVYPLVADRMPAFLNGQAISFDRVISMMYFSNEGIYGRLLQLFSTLIIVFLIFGAFLTVSGAGRFFVNLSMALAGNFRGGPAKVSVIASALVGMINGSSMANAATAGTITIPLMKATGYKPVFAAAVEAVASNGGQIMPPVMGLAVFLMVDFLGVSYGSLVIAGALPAILYFLAVLFMVDFEAAKVGMRGLPRNELPSLSKTLADGWIYLLPIVVLVWFLLVVQYSAETSCVYSIITMVVASFFKKDVRMTPRRLVSALSEGVQTIPPIGGVVALAGMLTASMGLTGLGVRMTGGLVTVAAGNLWVLLVLAAIGAMVLGLALSTSTTYILCAILIVPSLVKMGVAPLVAHFFVLYFGVAAMISPPICEVAFVTAAIAGAPFMKTGFQAMRLGILTFILPFIFVLSPEILMIGSPGQIVLAVVTSVVGVFFLAAGMEGYLVARTGLLSRVLLLAAGVLMLLPGPTFDIPGLLAGSLVAVLQVHERRLALRRAKS